MKLTRRGEIVFSLLFVVVGYLFARYLLSPLATLMVGG